MTTESEAREIWKAIEDFQKKDNDERAIQQKADSDARRATAIDYIKTLDLALKEKTTADKKTECYDLMEFCKDEIQKAGYPELQDELNKKINELLVQANTLKDLQREEKVG